MVELYNFHFHFHSHIFTYQSVYVRALLDGAVEYAVYISTDT